MQRPVMYNKNILNIHKHVQKPHRYVSIKELTLWDMVLKEIMVYYRCTNRHFNPPKLSKFNTGMLPIRPTHYTKYHSEWLFLSVRVTSHMVIVLGPHISLLCISMKMVTKLVLRRINLIFTGSLKINMLLKPCNTSQQAFFFS